MEEEDEEARRTIQRSEFCCATSIGNSWRQHRFS